MQRLKDAEHVYEIRYGTFIINECIINPFMIRKLSSMLNGINLPALVLCDSWTV